MDILEYELEPGGVKWIWIFVAGISRLLLFHPRPS